MTAEGDELDGVVVVIPVHEPDESVIDNVGAAARSTPVVVVDDGSRPGPVLRLLRSINGVEWASLPANRGIAAALNVGLQLAERLGARYLVMLDQDARIPEDDLRRLLAHVRAMPAGVPTLVGPGTAGALSHPRRGPEVLSAVDEILQSGMAMSTETFTALGGLREDLVIDGVDTEYCLRALASGGAVLAAHDVTMEHRLGRGTDGLRLRVGSWRPTHTGHSPARRYYMTRNKLRLMAQHGRSRPRWALTTLRRLVAGSVFAMFLGPDRVSQARAVTAGVRDAACRVSGPYRQTPGPGPR